MIVLTQQISDGHSYYIEQMFLSQGARRLQSGRGMAFLAGDRISSAMGRSAPRSPALRLYLALNAAALLSAAALMTLLAARAGGFSGPRLILISAAGAFGLAAVAAAFYLRLNPGVDRRILAKIVRAKRPLTIALAPLFLAFWCLTWFPPQYSGDAYYYFIGLYPLILCGLLAAGSALVLMVTTDAGSTTPWWADYLGKRRPALLIALATLAALGLVALIALQFGILRSSEPFWYGAGVPLLAAQVLIATLITALAFRLENWPGTRRLSADLILFILIWVIAAALWAARPVPASYWVTAPRAPNFEYYPFSDLITYDIASQFALIGQGIYNGIFFDRALYMSFLVYLHAIGGQNYQQLMSIQAALFAVFPALLFLLGKQLHSRLAGLMLAALITLRGLTGLDASAWIDTATFKHMLTDFPTAVGVAGFLVLILRWIKAPRDRLSSLIWAGGVLGLTSLLRPHVLLLLAAAALLAIWVYRPEWRRALSASALALLAFLMAVLPWMTLGPTSGSPLGFYGARVADVIAQRYPRLTATPAPIAATPAASLPTAVPATVDENLQPAPPADPGLPFVADHFLHNLVTSALLFPSTPQFLSVRGIVKEGEGFWRPKWDGRLSPLAALTLLFSLALLAFGVGIALQRDRLRGLLPIVVFLLYILANAFARTSGGRYIVPVDWILIAYFCIASAELLQAFRSSVGLGAMDVKVSPTEGRQVARMRSARSGSAATSLAARFLQRASSPLVILLMLLLLGGLIPLAGVLYPRRYARAEPGALLAQLAHYAPQAASLADLRAFQQQENAAVVEGRLLYPLYYRQGEGEPTRYAPYTSRNYPRTVFMLIGPQGTLHVMLPGAPPDLLLDASDVIVLGCRKRVQNYDMIDALVITLPDQQLGLLRSPAAPLDCPVPDPVCDNNGTCL